MLDILQFWIIWKPSTLGGLLSNASTKWATFKASKRICFLTRSRKLIELKYYNAWHWISHCGLDCSINLNTNKLSATLTSQIYPRSAIYQTFRLHLEGVHSSKLILLRKWKELADCQDSIVSPLQSFSCVK